MATIDFDVVVAKVISSLFGESFILKRDQNICIKAVCCDDQDVFARLPTGFRKSIIYQTRRPLGVNSGYLGCKYRNLKANECSYVYIEVKANIL